MDSVYIYYIAFMSLS